MDYHPYDATWSSTAPGCIIYINDFTCLTRSRKQHGRIEAALVVRRISVNQQMFHGYAKSISSCICWFPLLT